MTSPHPLDTPLSRVLEKLKGWKGTGGKYTARCPAHEDAKASLSITTGTDGRVLLRCFAGCDVKAVVAAIGCDVKDLFASSPRPNGAAPYKPPADRPVMVKSYDYVDESGSLLYQVCRYEPKDFKQRRPDGKGGWIWKLEDVRRVLYRLPEVIEAAAHERGIYLCEGEKDADALVALGYAATTSAGGADSWRDEYAESLKGCEVTILPDNDDGGRAYAEQAAASLTNVGCAVRVVTLPGVPVKGDVSNWLDKGGSLDDLARWENETRVWTPNAARRLLWRLDEILCNEEIMRPPPVVLPFIAFAGRSTLLAAFEKSGKSTLAGAAMSALSLGMPFLGEPCPVGVTVVIGLEEYIGDAARRLRDMGANDTRIYVVDRLPGEPKGRLDTIRAVIGEAKPDLLIIDSLTAYSGGQITDSHASAQMGPLMQALTDLSHETGVAVVIIHHARKADGAYRDSTAIGGGVDILIEISTPDEAKDPTLRKAKVRGRIPTRGFQYRYDEQGREILLAHTSGYTRIEVRIPEYVRANPGCSRNQVAAAMNEKRTVALSAIEFLIKDGQLVDNGNENGSALHITTHRHQPMSGTQTRANGKLAPP